MLESEGFEVNPPPVKEMRKFREITELENKEFRRRARPRPGRGNIFRGPVVDHRLASPAAPPPKRFDIVDILCTKDRDYLIKRNGNRVKVDKLAGKFVCCYFVPLPYPNIDNHDYPIPELLDLIDLYSQLSKSNKGSFEVVFLAGDGEGEGNFASHSSSRDLKKRYNYLLSTMPWLAIPFVDHEARKRVSHELGFSTFRDPSALFLDRSGQPFTICSRRLLKYYGAEAFPFTKERIHEIRFLDEEAKTGKSSLETLLSSAHRDFLISNDGRQVPICNLEGKTVGLFFYLESAIECDRLTKQLKSAYQRHKEDFEVVLIHIHFAEDVSHENLSKRSFQKIFKSIPWLALPFQDPICRKLWRIFLSPHLPGDLDSEYAIPILVIIGPNGSYIERHGAEVLERYGDNVFPFTRKKAAEIEVATLKTLRLDSLIDRRHVLRGKDESSKVRVSELLGKRVLLLFAETLYFGCNLILWTLKNQYCKNKGTKDEFEVLYISLCEKECYYHDCVADLPWLAHPYDIDFARKLASCFFKRFSGVCGSVALVAFGPDGHFLAKEAIYNYNYEKAIYNNYAKKDLKRKAFPFIDKDMELETMEDISYAYRWGSVQ